MAKSIISYESIREELLTSYKESVRSLPAFIFFTFLFCLGFIGYGIYLMYTDKYIGGIIVIIIFIVIFLYVTIYGTLSTFVELKMVEQGNFSIVTDTVTHIETVRRRSSVSYTAHFRYSGKYPLTNIGQALTSVDDVFYLVILGKRIISAYNTTLYQYKDQKK